MPFEGGYAAASAGTANGATNGTAPLPVAVPAGKFASEEQKNLGPKSVVDGDWEARIDTAKLKVRSELTLAGWRQYGFGTRRAAEFEALREVGDRPAGAVPRFRHGELSLEEFFERYEKKGLPCVISGTPEVENWPAGKSWNWQEFCRRFPKATFRVGKEDNGKAVRVGVDDFAKYMTSQVDDSPVYLFDNKFGDKSTEATLLSEYRIPSYFPDDYMELAGSDGRPPYRWVGIGPKRSGTVCHQDPLCTSAWNTLLEGRKRWLLLPAETPRKVAKGKAVMEEDDDDEAINYFLDLLPRLRKMGIEPVEFVQYPGDTCFIPGGWWHCVLNLDDTVAVTQNYCGRHNFPLVWRDARIERPCWSHKWLKAMDKQLPELAARARALNAQDSFDMEVKLQQNRERRKKRQNRRGVRELRKAKRRHVRKKGKAAFDVEGFWSDYRKSWQWQMDQEHSDSTVSTTSSSESDSSSEDSET
eukprot:TRINITY_DN12329_c0_g1_i1.p1 TRINITY_DN12329_c0_g1~~TRINITY_DN12329_c0_g1_i1.p1  ORF type:complete len:498 (-),score=112.02 TRINITY_DN12329_c0_g1_i1:15-1430(-)